MKKKILFVSIVTIIVVFILVSLGVFLIVRQGKDSNNFQAKSQEEILHEQIRQIDAEYQQKIDEIVTKQKENGCIAEKEVEMTKTLTGEKVIEKRWQTISTEGVCGDLQKQKDDLVRERSYKESQLQAQIDLLAARSESEREKAMESIRTFMGNPDLQLVYMKTRYPSNFNVGKITNQNEGGFTMEGVPGWERKVEIYQQTEFINDLCEVYEYEVNPRNNQIIEIHVRYPEGIPTSPDDRTARCAKFGSFYYPLKTKDQIEQMAFEYLGRAPESTGSMLASSSIQPQYIPSMKGAVNPAQNEWRWEDKNYKLPDGLYSDAFAYPVLRIVMSSGGKLIYYFNSTGLFN